MSSLRLRDVRVGTKLSLLVAVLVFIGFSAMSLYLSREASRELNAQLGADLDRQQQQVIDMISLFDRTLQQEADRFLDIFMADLAPRFSLDRDERIDVVGQSTPALRNDGRLLNGDYSLPDAFTTRTGTPVTIFARDGDDFVRVTTSLTQANGDRAVGTRLDRTSRSYARLMRAETYDGIANLFGTNYITRYQPIVDDAGHVIGASFIGIDITRELAMLEDEIRQMTHGASGYTMIADTSAASPGRVIAGGPFEGRSLAALKDVDGNDVFAPLWQQAAGRIDYRLTGDDERRRTTYFTAYPDWHWAIASTVFQSETDAGIVAMRNKALIAALLLTLLIAALLFGLQRRLIGKPLHDMVEMARELARGDLSQRHRTDRGDEIGQLAQAMNGIGSGLANIVSQVRGSTRHVQQGADEIAQGSVALSTRTDQTASSLQETSASLEEITATVQNTSSAADQAAQLVTHTRDVAQRGDDAMQRAQSSMHDINQSSAKIGEIITLIDSIAFQTNILALNASVEAARAGEHGRGFAVVAQEVRALALRSASAAEEIRSLVDTSIRHSRSGDEQVGDAAAQVAEILKAVERVDHMIHEISTGAREQSEGIGQINTAVVELDSMTQQNTSMVSQSSKAADEMRDQARRLTELMATFTLGEDQRLDEYAASGGQPAAAAPKTDAVFAARAAVATPPASTRARRPAPPPAPATPNSSGAATLDDDDWSAF